MSPLPSRRRGTRNGIVVAIVVVSAAAFVAISLAIGSWAAHEPQRGQAGPHLDTGVAVDRRVPSIQLRDDRGRRVSLADYRGRWLVLAPSLTLCHEVCPMTTGVLMRLSAQLRSVGMSRRVAVAEASVDPWRDTPARLRAYRRLTGVRFDLLTGSRAELRRLWAFFGVHYRRVAGGKPADRDWLTGRPERFDVEHSDGLFVIGPSGRERAAVTGMPDVGGHLSPALHGLLNESGRANLAGPRLPWSAEEVLADLRQLSGALGKGRGSAVQAPRAAAARRQLRGSPPALAGLHRQAGRLLSGDDLGARLRRLRGFPVVVNAWASWCLPCREEFGLLSLASADDGRRVAFLGADVDDGGSQARDFLADHPVSYPSLAVSSSALRSLAPITGLPTTLFFDRRGKFVGTHPGPYESERALAADIERYLRGR